MKYAFVSLAALAVFAAAQQSDGQQIASALGSLPECSLDCFQQALSQSGCELTDIECQCTTGAPRIAEALGPCLCESTCEAGDFATIGAFSDQMCEMSIENYTPQRAGLDPAACSSSASSGTASATGTGTETGTETLSTASDTRTATSATGTGGAAETTSTAPSRNTTGTATDTTAQSTSTGAGSYGGVSNGTSNSTNSSGGSTTQSGTEGTPTTLAGGASRVAGGFAMAGLFVFGLMAL